jgi:CubicO group peptidase (beta-lactamase class C family)
MNKKLFSLMIIFVVLVSAVTACGTNNPQTTKNYSNTIETAREVLWQTVTAGEASSATVALMDNGSLVYQEGFAMGDRENATSVDYNTQFNIGSVSKMFTAVAVLKLCQDELIDLDTPVTEYLPDFEMADERYVKITPRMLLNHTSGMQGTYAHSSTGSQQDESYTDDFFEYLKSSHLKSNPGGISVYCNDGFTLAEILIEEVSGETYADYIKTTIFTPANMSQSSCYYKENNENIAYRYDNETGEKLPVEYLNIMGAGGISSTPVDLCQFAQALFSKQILNEDYLSILSEAQYGTETVPEGTPLYEFGLGWDTVSVDDFEQQGVTVLSKNGGSTQYNSMLYAIPEENIYLALVVSGEADTTAIANKITQTLLEELEIVTPAEETIETQPASDTIPDDLLQYEGCYGNDKSIFKISFDTENNTLNYSTYTDGVFVETAEFTYKEDGYFYSETGLKFKFSSSGDKNIMLMSPVTSDRILVHGESVAAYNNPVESTLFDNSLWIADNLSAVDFLNFTIATDSITELPGYIVLNDLDTVILYGLKDENTGEMVLEYARDQGEPVIKDGKLNYLGYQFVNTEDIDTIKMGNKISVSQSNALYKIEETGLISFETGENQRLVLITEDGEILFDSLFSSQTSVSIDAGCYVSFVGEEGDILTYSFTSSE